MGETYILRNESPFFYQENNKLTGEWNMKIKLFISFLLTWQMVCPQTLYKTTEDYFRANPFKMEFNQFLSSFINDPALSEKKIKKKTDSTLFYLQGVYLSYSPFFFPATRCKIILAEQQEYTDSSLNETYTYFVYQLIGYAPPGKEGLKDIQQEFERLKRRFKKGFYTIDQKDLQKGGEQMGAIINYTFKQMVFHPLTIAWATSPGNKENLVTLSIRFLMIDNKAYLPISPDSP